MIFKKAFGKIYGVELNKSEQEALDAEIRKECADAIDQMERQVDILMLWELHAQAGWGKKRLERFYKEFAVQFNALKRYYQSDNSDDIFWIMERQLKEIDVDIDKLIENFQKSNENGI